mmetsp:Transcript_6634/g.19104  ORF Transcript_6634/g.19104 Transcript_6634/m.19104 type:complete len:125 (-) Transcript_6634:40-414(-)
MRRARCTEAGRQKSTKKQRTGCVAHPEKSISSSYATHKNSTAPSTERIRDRLIPRVVSAADSMQFNSIQFNSMQCNSMQYLPAYEFEGFRFELCRLVSITFLPVPRNIPPVVVTLGQVDRHQVG